VSFIRFGLVSSKQQQINVRSETLGREVEQAVAELKIKSTAPANDVSEFLSEKWGQAADPVKTIIEVLSERARHPKFIVPKWFALKFAQRCIHPKIRRLVTSNVLRL